MSEKQGHPYRLFSFSKEKVEWRFVVAGNRQKICKTANQVALRWLIQQEMVAAIPKAANPEHQKGESGYF